MTTLDNSTPQSTPNQPTSPNIQSGQSGDEREEKSESEKVEPAQPPEGTSQAAEAASPAEEELSGDDANRDPLEMALRELPQSLLHYADAVPITSDDDLYKVVSPCVLQQGRQLSERPVVTSTNRVLDSILPPREFTYLDTRGGGQKTIRMLQTVSHNQATRPEIKDLEEVFAFKLKDSKARSTGICPVRRAIYGMLFDELLRQVTLDNPERGLLLLHIRDELRLTMDAYKTLNEAAVQYATTKANEATKGMPEMVDRIKTLTHENELLRAEVRRLDTKHIAMLRCVEDQQQAEAKKHAEEKAFLERTKQRLLQHLDTVKKLEEEKRKKQREEMELAQA